MELFKLFGTIAINNNEANQAIDDTTGKAEQSENRMVSAFKKIGTAIATYFAVDKIISFGKEIVNTSATVDAELSAFQQIMGDYSDTAQAKMNEVADTTGVVSTRLTPYMTSLTAKFKGLGFDIDDATTLAQDGLMLASDASAFWDKSLDESVSHLNSFVNGSYEGGEAIGLFANDTQMASYAVKNGIVSETNEWANLDEARKQATRLEYAKAMFEASGAVGQAKKESEQYANVQANLTEKWRQFKAEIGEPLLNNVVLPAMQKLSDIVDIASQKFEELKSWVSENKDTLEDLKGKIDTIVTVVGIATTAFLGLKAGMAIQALVQGFQTAQVTLALFTATSNGATIAQGLFNGSLTLGETLVGLFTGKVTLAQLASAGWAKAQTVLNAVLSANPIALVVMAIVALVAIFVVLWNKCEGFRNFWIGLWEGIKTVFNAVVEWFKTTVSSVTEWFKSTVSSVKEWFKITVSSVTEWFKSTLQTVSEFFSNLWNEIITFLSSVWETISNIIQVGIMLIVEILTLAFDLITLPFRFIWENCSETIISVWNSITLFLSGVINNITNFITTKFNAIKDFISNVFNAIKNFITTVWNAIVNFLTPILENIKNTITNVFNNIKNTISSIFNSVQSTVSSIWNNIKSTISNTVNNIKNTISSIFNSVQSTVSSIWNNIKSTISNTVNNISSTVSNTFNSVKSNVSSTFNSVKSTVSNVWNGIYNAIKTPIENAKNAVSNGIDTIKNKFNFNWSLPKLKLPHFNVSGEFSLNPPKVPSFGIQWYKKAYDNPMILDSPTLFGYSNGKLLGGGDGQGGEVVAGQNTLMNMIKTAVSENTSSDGYYVQKLIDMLSDLLPQIINNLDRPIVLNDGTLVSTLAPQFDEVLGEISDGKGRGR